MKASPYLVLALMLAVCFTLATGLQPRAAAWSKHSQSDNVFGMLFGDGRRLFANQFFTMADVYFHSGYYPSIFDLRDEGPKEIVAESHGHTDSAEDEKNEDFLGKPKDWIDRFGRRFRITEHTHLEHMNEREILPWLRLAADMDPQKIETYTVGSFFMREHLNQPREAEAFLREGLRNNLNSYEILFELGRLYSENYHDAGRARNVWQLALNKWYERFKLDPEAAKENKLDFEEITVHLAHLEADAGNYEAAIRWFQATQKVSPEPGALQQQIDEIKKKMAAQANAPAAAPHQP
jgi:tetratricopeptide (TPR) repeat protein